MLHVSVRRAYPSEDMLLFVLASGQWMIVQRVLLVGDLHLNCPPYKLARFALYFKLRSWECETCSILNCPPAKLHVLFGNLHYEIYLFGQRTRFSNKKKKNTFFAGQNRRQQAIAAETSPDMDQEVDAVQFQESHMNIASFHAENPNSKRFP